MTDNKIYICVVDHYVNALFCDKEAAFNNTDKYDYIYEFGDLGAPASNSWKYDYEKKCYNHNNLSQQFDITLNMDVQIRGKK